MARPRTPKAKARATGRDTRDPARFADRNEPIVAEAIGGPPDWMNADQRKAWGVLIDEIPWLNKSHRGLVEIAATIRARLISGSDVGVQALVLLKQCLSAMGATPADSSKAGIVPGGEQTKDPAEGYF